MSYREVSASTVNMFSSWYDSDFFLSFMTLRTIGMVGVVGEAGVVGFVVKGSNVGKGGVQMKDLSAG